MNSMIIFENNQVRTVEHDSGMRLLEEFVMYQNQADITLSEKSNGENYE